MAQLLGTKSIEKNLILKHANTEIIAYIGDTFLIFLRK